MRFMYKIKKLFKNAYDTINEYGFGNYGRKMLNIAVFCLIVLSVFFGAGDAVFPYLNEENKLYIEEKYNINTSDSEIRKNQEIHPLKDNFKNILKKSKLISWKDASNIIKDNEFFYLYDVETKGICISMKKISQQNLYNAIPYGKYEFKILNSILKDKVHMKRRGGIIEYNNSYYIASYDIDKFGVINIHFVDSKTDENIVDGLHQNEIYKVLKKKEAI